MKNLRFAPIAFAAVAASLLFVRPVRAEQGWTPTAAEYPVAKVPMGLISEPILDTPAKAYFRTRIRAGASQGSNFGGHYAFLQWGCGDGCSTFFIVDELSGQVFEPGFHLTAPKSGTDQSSGFVYKADSRLLVMRGCRNNEAGSCGTYYMLWTGSALNTLMRVPLPTDVATASGMQ